MSVDNVKQALPEYAKDLKLNLSSLARSKELNEQQLWGAMVAGAAATRNAKLYGEIADEAQNFLSEEAFTAAKAAAAIMAQNNVAYRAQEFLGEDYAKIRFGLRQNVMAKPGVDKIDFELWNIVVSVINGCQRCTAAHDHTVREGGLKDSQVWEAVKIAATLQGIAQVFFLEDN